MPSHFRQRNLSVCLEAPVSAVNFDSLGTDVIWGLGLHVADLTKPQLLEAMKAFWAYQIMFVNPSSPSQIR